MKKKMIKCNGMTDEQINTLISNYVKLGWNFIGISEGFPADYQWVHLECSKDKPPIYPETESNS